MQLKWILLAAAAGAFAYWWSRQPKTVLDPGCGHGAPPGRATPCEVRVRKVCPPGQCYDRTALFGFGACVPCVERVPYVVRAAGNGSAQ